jgi:putative transcriptional regulator
MRIDRTSTTRESGVASFIMTFSRAIRATRLVIGAMVLAALLGLTPAETVRRGPDTRLARHDQSLEAGAFLIATHRINDPRFSQSVILLTQHGAQGAMGVIINRPTEHRLAELLPEIEALEGRSDLLFFGGPVSLNAIVILLQSREEVKLELTTRVFGDVYFSGNPEALAYILGRKRTDEAIRGYAGYAGWAPGQLEGEIARGDWTIAGADAFTIFKKDPSEIWRDLSPEPLPRKELRAGRYPERLCRALPSSRETPRAW